MSEASEAQPMQGQTRAGATAGYDLPRPVSGVPQTIERRAGRVAAYVAGEGALVLLVHSINAAGSAYEVQPIFEHLRQGRRVWAIDLPGFGASDRSARDYDVRLFVDAIHDAIDTIADDAGDQPVDALALSLSSEFLARAARERPERFRSLAFVTPTGFDKSSDKLRQPEGSTRAMPWLNNLLEVPPWRRALFDLLVSRRSIRFFLKKTFGSDQIDQGLADYAYLTTHQPGARHAPYAFVSGKLFSTDIRTVYEQLAMPVWLAHGTKGDFQDFSGAGWVKSRANWRMHPFDTGALPHFEQAHAFLAAYDAFLADVVEQP
jgi:pimeloyl-ACP methyl ester carboxylesterase